MRDVFVLANHRLVTLAMGALGSALQKANYDPALAQTLIQHSLQDPNLPAQGKAQLQQMQQQIAQNPGVIKQLADTFVAQSPKYNQLTSEAMTEQAHQSQAQTVQERLQPEMPKLQADATIAQANAAVAPQNASWVFSRSKRRSRRMLRKLRRLKSRFKTLAISQSSHSIRERITE
jgi:hypothetical protein